MRDAPSKTAEVICLMRAADRRRKADARILDDPYAELFLRPAMRATLKAIKVSGRLGARIGSLSPGLTTFVLARHRFIDDGLDEALHAGRVEQLVILGAGYDTRAYRFAARLGAIPVFEVDHPSTGRRKEKLVKKANTDLPNIEIRRVGIDFQRESLAERLEQAGFRRGARTLFIWEGVSMYLTRAAVQSTLRTIRTLGAVGSDVLMDFWYLLDAPDLVTTAHRMSANLLHFLSEPVTFGIHPEDVLAFLQRLGFELVDLAVASELESRYVRDSRHVYPANYVVQARSVLD